MLSRLYSLASFLSTVLAELGHKLHLGTRKVAEGTQAALLTKRESSAGSFTMANQEGVILIKQWLIVGKVLHEEGLKGGIVVA